MWKEKQTRKYIIYQWAYLRMKIRFNDFPLEIWFWANENYEEKLNKKKTSFFFHPFTLHPLFSTNIPQTP